MILKKIFVIFLFFPVFLISCSKTEKSPDPAALFMQARIDGDIHKAYLLLDKATQAAFSEKDFEEYCFVFKPSEFEILPEENGYIPISYTFYDKKYNKESGELYTFYMTKNIEHQTFRRQNSFSAHCLHCAEKGDRREKYRKSQIYVGSHARYRPH